MSFLDEDDDFATAPSRRPPSRPEPEGPTRQQLMARRAMAAGAALLLLVLVVLGVRGCLDARKERALKDYVQDDVQALTDESNDLGKKFFQRLDDPGGLTGLDFENEIKSSAGGANQLLDRARKLSAPDEMERGHEALVLAFELRADALKSIASDLQKALGRDGSRDAISRIAGQMQALLASDVIYSQRAFPAITRELGDERIEGVKVPASRFLPDIDWLLPSRIREALGKVRGGRQTVAPGVHGVGLIEVVATPGDITLDQNAPAALRAGGSPTLQVKVQNQGESTETDVAVKVRITGGDEDIELERTISEIDPGETKTANIAVTPAPPTGSELKIEAEVEAVPGEKVEDNNSATYTVTYG